MDFTVQQILLLLIIFPTMISSKRSCPVSYCESDKVPIKYPFTLETNHQEKETCHDYISLKCNDQGNKTMINLPAYGDFEVNWIDYITKTIALLTDPGHCLPKRLIGNFSLNPLIAFYHEDYTYFTCLRKPVQYLYTEISCLSNSTNVTIAAQSSPELMKAEYGCEPIVSAKIPLSFDNHNHYGIPDELELTWGVSGCKDCEDYGFEMPGDSRSKLVRFFTSPIFITIAALLATFFGVAIFLSLLKIVRTRRNTISAEDNLAITDSATTRESGPRAFTSTAQSTTIESTVSLSQLETSSGIENCNVKDHAKLI